MVNLNTGERLTLELSDYVVNQIIKEMKKRKLRKSELARKMGKSPQWLGQKLERGILINDLILFADALGLHVVDFFPPKWKYNIQEMTLVEFIKAIFKDEIEKHNKENVI